jgi:hypothetical protein
MPVWLGSKEKRAMDNEKLDMFTEAQFIRFACEIWGEAFNAGWHNAEGSRPLPERGQASHEAFVCSRANQLIDSWRYRIANGAGFKEPLVPTKP